MYGIKARIGLIVPSVNIVMEPELTAMCPKGISLHSTRIPFKTSGFDDLMQMAEGIDEAAVLLKDAGVDVIAYGCTIGSLFKGKDWDQVLIKQIEEVTDLPAITTSTAVITVLKNLQMDKIAIATPYSNELNQIEKDFIEYHGIEVVNIKGLNLRGVEFQQALPEHTYELARKVDVPNADAIFISCTNFKSATLIQKLEKELRKYIFSSNTATMWHILKRLDFEEPIKGFGKIFGQFSKQI